AWGRWIYVNIYPARIGVFDDDWLTVLVGVPLALLVYLGMHWLLRSDEWSLTLALLRRRSSV
ncbi:MAG: hypothetical protein WAU00_09830, partial [Caldilinea sp.]